MRKMLVTLAEAVDHPHFFSRVSYLNFSFQKQNKESPSSYFTFTSTNGQKRTPNTKPYLTTDLDAKMPKKWLTRSIDRIGRRYTWKVFAERVSWEDAAWVKTSSSSICHIQNTFHAPSRPGCRAPSYADIMSTSLEMLVRRFHKKTASLLKNDNFLSLHMLNMRLIHWRSNRNPLLQSMKKASNFFGSSWSWRTAISK